MQKITPVIWCNGNASQAAEFYARAFPKTTIGAITLYPDADLLEFQRGLEGQPLTIDVNIDGYVISLLNAGAEFPVNPSISFMVRLNPAKMADPRAELDAIHGALLAEGGTDLMEKRAYEFSPYYVWVQDHFGVSWQLMVVDEADTRPFVMPCLLFGERRQNQAGPAMQYYREVFGDTEPGFTAPYPPEMTALADNPLVDGALMYTDATLGGLWLAAMDSGVKQDYTFSEGVSLMVACQDQAEIDRLWAALSRVPEAE